MQHLILFGPPGSGKGTQAAKLLEKYNLIHISTGDLFRYEMKHDTELGTLAKSYMSQGKLVPDAVTIGMLKNKVEKHPDANGFIYDGFPRTVAQAEALDAYLAESEQKISGLVAMQVDDEEIIKRIMLRGATSGRADDNDESIIRNRIKVYNAETYPVFEHYKEFERAHWVDGLGTIDEIFDRLCDTIDRIF